MERVMFSDPQLRIIVDVLISAGEVLLASLVIPFFIGQFSVIVFTVGVIFMTGAWIIALFIGKHIRS